MKIFNLFLFALGFLQAQGRAVQPITDQEARKDSLYTLAKQQEDLLLYRDAFFTS